MITGNHLAQQAVEQVIPFFPVGVESDKVVSLEAAEYFFDNDPGEGKGYALLAEDMKFDSSTEGIVSLNLGINDLPAAGRRVGIRFKDSNHTWGSVRYLDFESEDAVDYTPSRIILRPNSIAENTAAGEWEGNLSTLVWTTSSSSQTFTYQLLEDSSSDNHYFSISGNKLSTSQEFNFEDKQSLRISVRSTDGDNQSIDSNITLRITDDLGEDEDSDGLSQLQENALGTDPGKADTDGDGISDGEEYLAGTDPTLKHSRKGRHPHDIEFIPGSISESTALHSMVAQIVVSDEDDPLGLDSYLYELVTGDGSTHNQFFSVETNGSLMLKQELDFETNQSLSIRMKVTDPSGLQLVKSLSIKLIDDILEDIDGDGLNQAAEKKLGTREDLADSDQDGHSDYSEVLNGTDPLNDQSYPRKILLTPGCPISMSLF